MQTARDSAGPQVAEGETASAGRRPPRPVIVASILLLVGLLFPSVVRSNYLVELAISGLFSALLGLSWNLVSGYTGQFSFGHAAFYGVGAYTTTYLLMKFGLSPWIGMLAGGLLAALVAVFIGYLSFRYGLKQAYFALATLGFAQVLMFVMENTTALGGSVGLLIPLQKGNPLWTLQFATKVPYYYLMLAMVAVLALLTALLERSRTGAFFLAIREDQSAAAALGVNTFRYKLLALAMSGFATALGGAFYALYRGYIDPPLVFGADQSIWILFPAIIGGAGTVAGPLLGALCLLLISELSKYALRGWTGMDLVLFGVVLVLVTIYMQEGLIGFLRQIGRTRLRRRRGAE